MENDLSFWRKLMLDLNATPKTDADLAYLYRNLVRPEIPASALWDAEEGAKKRASYEQELYGHLFKDVDSTRPKAIRNRGWGIDQKPEDMPYKTPTGRIMEQLLNPDRLIVPDKNKMGNIWE